LVDDLSGVKHRAMMYRWIYFRPLMEFLASLRSLRSILLRSKTAHHARGSRVRDYGWNSVQSFKKTEKDSEAGKMNTVGKLFTYEGTESALRDTQIASECMDHLVAGVDTTGDTLCFTMWSLSRPEYAGVQEKLFEELKSIDFPEDGVPSIQDRCFTLPRCRYQGRSPSFRGDPNDVVPRSPRRGEIHLRICLAWWYDRRISSLQPP
jgi:cytochrome P450